MNGLAVLVRNASSLGAVPRDYETPTSNQDGRYTHQRVADHGFTWQDYMLPDADGTLEVLASCMKHYARQPQAQVGRTVVPCLHKHCSGKPS